MRQRRHDPIRHAVFRFAWRLNFTGRMMEKTQCGFREGMRRANDAIAIRPDWWQYEGAQIADERMKIYEPFGKRII